MFNFRCFENAVQYAQDNPGLEVVEVIYIDNGDPILHYVNFNPDSGEYLETTLGWKHIPSEFSRALDSWTEEWATWWERKVLGIERVL